MTILFDSLSENDIVKKYATSNLVIMNKYDKNHSISIENYNKSSHNLVYADNLKKIKQVLASTSTNINQTTHARNEVLKAAGLAST